MENPPVLEFKKYFFKKYQLCPFTGNHKSSLFKEIQDWKCQSGESARCSCDENLQRTRKILKTIENEEVS